MSVISMKSFRKTAAFAGLLGAVAVALLLGFGAAGRAMDESGKMMGDGAKDGRTAVATFAGGCFWCMQPPFDALDGVISTTAGYTGGHVDNPTYDEVSRGGTGHAESVQVVYDPSKVSYEKLLDVFWHNVDPVTYDAQFCDHGHQYRTAIFYHDAAQEKAARASKLALEKSGKLPGPVVTEIDPASTFWMAEGYHQAFYKTHPLKYKFYRFNCGRDRRLKQLWGDEAGGHHG
jgi:peptide-methionine (S)-S-oxide reductase